MKHYKLKFLSVFILLSLLSGCAFKLRQQNLLPFKTLLVESPQPFDPFTLALKQTLTASGIKLVKSPQHSPLTLNIVSTHWSHSEPNIISTDQPMTYTFTYKVTFTLQKSKALASITKQTITSSRNLVLSPNQTLFSNNQAQELKTSMEEHLINLMLYRLGAENIKKALK